MRALLLAAALLLTGCATQQAKQDLSAFKAANPRSILVVPAANKSLDVDAPNYLLTTLTVPLAEKGYYVFPVHTSKTVLEQEGFYDGDQVQKQPPESLARLFGADAVLFVTINRWDAQYAILATTVTVDFDYRLVSKDGTELWKANKKMQYTPQNNSTGNPIADLVASAVTAALQRAKPNYMPLAQMANAQVLTAEPTAIPNGPYLPLK
nr:GNA1162 family protein [uncultured Massilia sp.]